MKKKSSKADIGSSPKANNFINQRRKEETRVVDEEEKGSTPDEPLKKWFEKEIERAKERAKQEAKEEMEFLKKLPHPELPLGITEEELTASKLRGHMQRIEYEKKQRESDQHKDRPPGASLF